MGNKLIFNIGGNNYRLIARVSYEHRRLTVKWIGTHAVRPIRSREDLNAALKRLDEIFDAPAGSPEGDEAEVLTIVIRTYEREHFPIGESDPVEALKFHMERLGLKQADLIPFMGASSRVSEVMNRKRSLTVEMVRNLSSGLGIPAESLLGQSRPVKTSQGFYTT